MKNYVYREVNGYEAPIPSGLKIPVKLTLANRGNYGGARPLSAIDYIVVHYTANDWDSDESNGRYFRDNVVKASANWFVDDDSYTISVPDDIYAWHCGGPLQGSGGHSMFGKCNNWNSIGIEMCSSVKDGKAEATPKTIQNTIELVVALMKAYNVPIDHVIRHWDVTGKECPKYFIGNNNKGWEDFKDRVEELTMIRYSQVSEVPEGIRDEVKEIVDMGALKGNGTKGIDMTYDGLRILVICLRIVKSLLKK